MPAKQKPKLWNIKPQLTAAPHMWKDVEHFLIGDVTQRKDFGAAGGQFTVNGSPNNVLTEQGRGIEFKSTNANVISCASHQQTVFTRQVLLKVTSTLNGALGNIVTTAESVSAPTHDRGIFIDGGFHAYVYDGSQRNIESSTVPVIGEIYHVAFTIGSGVLRIYVNGKDERAMSVGGAYTGYTTPEIIFGRGNSSYGSFILLQAVDWLRELSAEEIAEHARDPFAMLRPAGF